MAATLEESLPDLQASFGDLAPATEPVPPPEPPKTSEQPTEAPSGTPKVVDDVLHSDIGVNVILERFKQTITSIREAANVLKKRATLEEDRATSLRKLSRTTLEGLSRQDGRQGTFSRQFAEIMKINENMSTNGMQYGLSLNQMYDDLNELCNRMEKSRKLWKQNGLNPEKKFQDAKTQAEKAKAKYDSLAEEYDRAKTGDRTSGRGFGFKKSGAQHEEDLHRKLQAADADYASKVQAAEALRQELVSTLRPQAIKAIHELIEECDAALTLQLQKYVAFNEKQLLHDGMLVTPINTSTSTDPLPPSLSQIVSQIDNKKDFHDYVTSQASSVPRQTGEIKYEKHPTLVPQQSTPPPTQRQAAPVPQKENVPPPQPSFSGPPTQSTPPPQPTYQAYNGGYQQPPQLPPIANQPYQTTQYPPNPMPPHGGPMLGYPPTNTVPPRPVFGVHLEELFQRDGSPVPMVVYQCIQAVDLFGLDVEGIYRVPGTASHIATLKTMFDNDSESVDFRNPEAFFHDVNSVAGLLKQFFRDLPDPLLTSEHYNALIDSARIPDDTVRRDSMHAIINALPDPNYATLRTLVLHLHRVGDHAQANRMSTSNLAICFAPTLMGQHRGPMADAGLQARVIDTILANTYQIFDED